MNIYTLQHCASCPNGGLEDVYEIKIFSSKAIQVEKLIAVLKEIPSKIYQEDLADELRSKIPARIEISGCHHGIHILSIRQ